MVEAAGSLSAGQCSDVVRWSQDQREEDRARWRHLGSQPWGM